MFYVKYCRKLAINLIVKMIKKSLGEHQRMITLINNITDAILSTDEHGIINTYNSAALNLIDTNSGINGEYISQVLNLETTDKKPIDIFKELTKSSAIRQRDDILMKIKMAIIFAWKLRLRQFRAATR